MQNIFVLLSPSHETRSTDSGSMELIPSANTE